MDTTGLSHSHGQTPHQAAIVCLSFCKEVVSSKEQVLMWHRASWESSKIGRFHYWESVLLTLVEKAVQTTPWKVSACLPQRECPIWHGLSVLCLLCSQNVFWLSHFPAGIIWLLKQFIWSLNPKWIIHTGWKGSQSLCLLIHMRFSINTC